MTGNIDCNKCLWATRDGSCASWNCEFVPKSDAYKAWKEGVSNPPLSWDELRQMKGKPVWVEFYRIGKVEPYDTEWIIFKDINRDYMADTNEFVYKASDCGAYWKAYRKERV